MATGNPDDLQELSALRQQVQDSMVGRGFPLADANNVADEVVRRLADELNVTEILDLDGAHLASCLDRMAMATYLRQLQQERRDRPRRASM